MRGVTDDARPQDAPLLDELMPWSVAPLRFGRSWIVAPDARTLRTRWDRLVAAEGAEREALFRPSRARTPASAVAALPGQRTGTVRFAREAGPCPAPVRVARGPFDEQWLLPDHRLIDTARPELWRVAGEPQLFAVEQGYVPGAAGPALLVTAALPEGRSPAGRPGRIRPLFRRPGGREPNLAPRLLDFLGRRYGRGADARDWLAWTVAAARPSPAGCRVPLPVGPEVWAAGVALGRDLLDVRLRGALSGTKPRLPGGRRPYVRAAVPARPTTMAYDSEDEALVLDGGRISPVPAEAWEFRVGGVRVLEQWFAHRTAPAEPGSLEAIGPVAWPQEWTSELLDLITVLALLGAREPERAAFAARAAEDGAEGAAALRAAGVLPPPARARRPASVLDHPEEGPEGQFMLL
ncbi:MULTISPECIES: type ISP restriction/modification enzyme [unclassified Streptomyces]|uniref:type ISP restriction/modification enzyme n=1 Tax=unclassified Streptomyces TaxID=2593676 RepID=UPI0006AFCFA0|nr:MULTISPECIES: type ISP restriction/modification enzyme [unclassified Streptomyces]KOX38286.1 DNA methyltransferase [Streptomyces sp. NRRL F-6491]KOX52439.1 DNA methyltransferase [Streptomyces sp. NRRL F-6492]